MTRVWSDCPRAIESRAASATAVGRATMQNLEVFIASSLITRSSITHRRNSGSEFPQSLALPAVKCRMTFLDRHECTTARRADLATRSECSVDRCAVAVQIRKTRAQVHRPVCRCRTQELNRVIRGDGAGRAAFARLVHQVPRRRPVAVTIEERADNAAVQDAGERFILQLRLPFGDDVISARKTPHSHAVWICWAATETCILWRVTLLQRLRLVHSVLLRAVR